MRVVINEAQIKRNRQISHILFFVSLAGMGVGFFYTWTADATSTANQISCYILPILMLLTLTSVRMANNWIREPRPKDVLAEGLKGLGQKYTMFHYLLPAPHVLVGPEGVFTLTTVWQEGHYKVDNKKWQGDKQFAGRIMGYLRQDGIGNPFSDATLHAQQIQRLVDKIAPDSGIEVQPVIVVLNSTTEVELNDPLFPVLYADSKQKPSLRAYLKDEAAKGHATLSDEHLDKIDSMFGLMTRHEIAEMLGKPLDDDLDDGDIAEVEVHTAETTDAADEGTIFIAQAGQLFYIGVTAEEPQDAIDELDLQSEVSDDVEILRVFTSSNAERAAKRLRDKFDRKRQKEHWYGLGKKDIAWIMDQKDDLS